MNKYLIVSHERSGTHLCINTLALNLGFPIHNFNVTDKESMMQGGGIYKSHHDFESLEKIYPNFRDDFKVIYVVRRCFDVMVSSFFYHKTNGDNPAFPHHDSISKWLRDHPSDYSYDKPYSSHRHYNMVDRWCSHVEGWSNKESVLTVRYEDLMGDFSTTLYTIGKFIDRNPLACIKPDIKNHFSVSPRKGVVGDYINHLSEEDRYYIYSVIGNYNEKFFE